MTIDSMPQFRDADRCRTLVLKVGSSLLVDTGGHVRREWLRGFAGEIAELRARGQDIVVVSSGAIALGAARLGIERAAIQNLADAQAAACVGQIALAEVWASLFQERAIKAAQLLLTLGDLEERGRYLNACSTLSRLLEWGIVPIVNENDSVATEEIRFGDNDRLAARVAQAARADGVILLSDVDGLFDRAPGDPTAKLVPTIRGVTDNVRAMAGGASAIGVGTGGMTSKLEAAQIAERAGIPLAIINGTHDRPVGTALTAGIGTIFLPTRNDRARRAWLGGRKAAKGTLVVDAGCVAALREEASLLAVGIVNVRGDFARGDLVAVSDADGRVVAQGLAEYGAGDARVIMGLPQGDQAAALGHSPRSAVVHRDHLVLL
ncbi:MAG: glutamate 5-kinase [Pontixanthobacter sp.]